MLDQKTQLQLQKYEKLLSEFVAFKTISTSSEFSKEIDDCINWLQGVFTQHGFEVDIKKGFRNPIVVAEKKIDGMTETVLLYGHYDVIPAKASEWQSEPFVLDKRNDRFYARGTMDNKGLLLMSMINIFELIESNEIGYNVKFVIEGNEETGSEKMADFLKENKESLQSDFVYLSDGPQILSQPTIDVSFRGFLNLEIALKTLDNDVHSGSFGGVAPNAAFEMAKLLSKFKNPKDNKIQIPELYENVISKEDANNMTKEYAFAPLEYENETGTQKVQLEEGVNFYAQVGLRPSLEITGLQSGYTDDGYKNAIPASSKVKLNLRLAYGQSLERTISGVEKFVKETLPEYVDYTIDFSPGGIEGFELGKESKYFQKADSILKKTFGKQVLKNYEGATISTLKEIKEILEVPVISVPLANTDSNIHSANENISIDALVKGLEFSREFFRKEIN